MNDLSQTRLGQIFDSVSRGFQQTPLEILIFFLIVFIVVVIFVIVFFAQRRRARREMIRRSQEALRKIGLVDTWTSEVPTSSSQLPEGSPVLLMAPAGARFRGAIIAQGPRALSVKLSPGDPFPGKGVPLFLYFHNATGIYSFPTRSIYLTKDVVQVEQSSAVTFHKPRRKYIRRKQSLAVFVRSTSSGVPRESILLDLSARGASLQNPRGGLLKNGEMCELLFAPHGGKPVLAARVVRLSKLGTVAHVKFEPLSEVERKKIMTFIFAQSRRNGTRVMTSAAML